jgi:DNA-binding response OmpR family regulator
MRNKSILLVDDEEIILNSIGKNLRLQNYDVTLANSGEQAISLLNSSQFDLLVTDLSMPEIDGIQVLKEAKKINSLTAVIILTGYGDMSSSIEALRLGADDYLIKPCDPAEFTFRIKRCFEKQEAFRKVRLYENILPVCMYCKNIRDDTGAEPGKGKWLEMEKYIHSRSGTDISHTFCPQCQKRAEKDMLGE